MTRLRLCIRKQHPPRHFTFKGFLAVEYFSAPCDYIPCELRTGVRIQFAPDRFLHIEAERLFEQVEAILNQIDFDALRSEIDKRIESKKAGDKNKKPLDAERP